MSWKQVKPDASGVLTLLVAGAGMLLLAFRSLPSDQTRLGRGGPTVSRAAHPVVYWACEVVIILAGVVFIALGVRLFRALIRQQRGREQSLEKQAMDSFIRGHPGNRGGATNDRDHSN